ncbi:MAG: hypothetical protein CM1200mP30_25760 [Pseudomonadota bacterium]|nr:MAG: hypothetical protein CM1200mP30_25760 [Pseudomonadota bacterium]
MVKHTGNCLCGDVTLQVTGEPVIRETVTVLTAKKNTGAAYATIFFFKDEQVSFLSGKTSSFNYTADSGKKKNQGILQQMWFAGLRN